MLPLVILLELVGGMAILIGFKTRLVALLFVIFKSVSAVLFYNVAADASELNNLMKSIAIAGGFLMLLVDGTGAYAVDNRHK